MRRFVRTLFELAFVLSLSGTVAANGRFPRAQRLLEMQSGPDGLLLAATYGILLSEDRGASWRHLCELAYVFSIDDVDAIPAFTADGALLVSGTHSLNRAPAPWCNFEPVLGGDGTEQVPDFSVDPEDRDHVIALFMHAVPGGIENRVFESIDGGRSFSPLGQMLPSDEVAFSVTVDAAPSDPERLYVTALDRRGAPLFLRSTDRGESWEVFPIPGELGEIAYLAAVDPADPERLYVRTDLWALDDDGLAYANDRLLVSDDGGATLRESFRAGGKLFGFALSTDGGELLLGYGDPVDPVRAVDPAALGIYRGSADDGAFTKIFDGPVSCLSWTARGVYACTSQAVHGYALGFAPSPDFDADSEEPFSPLLRLPDVAGPYLCPECSGAAACVARWSESCTVFGNCDAGIAGSPGDCKDAGSDGGTGGGNDGGSGGETEGGGAGPGGDSGCGCRAGRPAGTGALFALAVLASVWRARARRRPVSARPPG